MASDNPGRRSAPLAARLNGVLDKGVEVVEVAAQRVANYYLPLRKREPRI